MNQQTEEALKDLEIINFEAQLAIAVEALSDLSNLDYWRDVTGSDIATEALKRIKQLQDIKQ